MRCVFIFAGQGTQYRGMGQELYRDLPVFREQFDRLDRVAAKMLSESAAERLYNHPGTGDRIRDTHPALFMVQYALARTLMDKGVIPDQIMGASLGEYVALALSGAVPAGQMLAQLIDHAGDVETLCRPGAMAGVMADPAIYRESRQLHENASLACVFSPRHFMVSGEREGMDRVRQYLETKSIGYQVLPIPYGFHSPNMDPAVTVWQTRLAGLDIPGQCRIPTVSCLTGKMVKKLQPAHLARIPRAPIRFPEACRTLSAGAGQGMAVVDLGPGGTGSVFMRQQGVIGARDRVFRVMTPGGREIMKFEKLINGLAP